MIRRFTKTQKRARIREILDGQSDDEIAALLKEMQDLSLAGLQIFKRRAGMTPGEIIVHRLRYRPHAHEVLRLPLRDRPLRDWLPPSYDEYVWRLLLALSAPALAQRSPSPPPVFGMLPVLS